MKLTKSQLKRIIKEELGKALKETSDSQKDIAGLAAASPLGTSPGTWTTATDVAPKLPKWSTDVINPEVFKMALEHVHRLVAEVNKITKNDFVKVYDSLDGTDKGTGPFCKKRTITKEATAGGPIYGDPEEHDLGDEADDIVGPPINRPDPDFTSAGELSSGFRGMFRGKTFAEWVDIGESNRPNPGKTIAKCIYKKIEFAPITNFLGLSIKGGVKGFETAMEEAQELYRKVEKEGLNSISEEERRKLFELNGAIKYLRVTMHGMVWRPHAKDNLMHMSFDMNEDLPDLLKLLGYHRRDVAKMWPPKQIKESKMKLTKSQLKRIIKEELSKVMEGSDEAIEAFNSYVIDNSLSRRTDESNLATFARFNPSYLESLPAIAAHYGLYKEDILGSARSLHGATGVLVAILKDALVDYEGPEPEADPFADLWQ